MGRFFQKTAAFVFATCSSARPSENTARIAFYQADWVPGLELPEFVPISTTLSVVTILTITCRSIWICVSPRHWTSMMMELQALALGAQDDGTIWWRAQEEATKTFSFRLPEKKLLTWTRNSKLGSSVQELLLPAAACHHNFPATWKHLLHAVQLKRWLHWSAKVQGRREATSSGQKAAGHGNPDDGGGF